MRDKRFDCDTVLTVIKMYRYIVYAEIFVTVNCGAVRDGYYHSDWYSQSAHGSYDLADYRPVIFFKLERFVIFFANDFKLKIC